MTSIMSIKKSSSNYNVSTSTEQQDEEEEASAREQSPPTKSTLDDPQRQCIIEFVDNMSPLSEEPQHHIANISYQQHPSPPQAGEQIKVPLHLP